MFNKPSVSSGPTSWITVYTINGFVTFDFEVVINLTYRASTFPSGFFAVSSQGHHVTLISLR